MDLTSLFRETYVGTYGFRVRRLRMDGIDTSSWRRVPLAEAVMILWRFAADQERLEGLFQRLRRRCYTKILEFRTLVQLLHDALLVYRGSGRQSFEHAREDDQLPVSIQAAFGKLRRVPIELSQGFLAPRNPLLISHLAMPMNTV
jgi:hypothetical protein